MEVTCNRCHQVVPTDSCYCPTCGLPQIVYTSEDGSAAATGEPSTGAVRDASTVEWKPALRVALIVSVPAAVIWLVSSGSSPQTAILSPLWMAAAATWAVTLYARKQRPAWITMGAGARIGLVTGILSGWFAFIVLSAALWAERFLLGQSKQLDEPMLAKVGEASQQLQQMSPDAQTLAAWKSFTGWLLTADGRAGSTLIGLLLLEIALVVFATAGGAIGARLMARSRRPGA